MAKSEGPSIWNFLHQMLRVSNTLNTLEPSFLGLDAQVNEDKQQHFYSICSEINKVLL